MIYISLLIGLCVGSFLNVVLFRLNRKKGIITGRSSCPECNHPLVWYDLIPLVSFFILKGKCRYCHKKISLRYPLIESIAGILFLLLFLFLKESAAPIIIFNFYIVSILILIFIFDYLYFLIPDKIALPAILVTFVFDIVFKRSQILNLFLSALLIAGLFAIIFIVSSGKWIGFGDVKLIFLIGLVLDYPLAFFSLVAAIWAGAIIGIILLATGKANMKTALPFGSLLSLAAIAMILFQNEIQNIIYKFI